MELLCLHLGSTRALSPRFRDTLFKGLTEGLELLQICYLLVMEAFFRQTCSHASVQKKGIQGLGKTIYRTHLDALHEAVYVIRRGEDKNWKMPSGVVSLEMFEPLIAVHLRHEEVKEHEIKWLRPEHL
jgi:hypothetical protein